MSTDRVTYWTVCDTEECGAVVQVHQHDEPAHAGMSELPNPEDWDYLSLSCIVCGAPGVGWSTDPYVDWKERAAVATLRSRRAVEAYRMLAAYEGQRTIGHAGGDPILATEYADLIEECLSALSQLASHGADQ